MGALGVQWQLGGGGGEGVGSGVRANLIKYYTSVIIISKSHLYVAKRILDTLKSEDTKNLNSFCTKCMFTESPSDDCKNKQFPQCGGKLVDCSSYVVLLPFYNTILIKYHDYT